MTSAAGLHGRCELGQPDVIQVTHDDLVQVAPHVPDAAVLGTDLFDGRRTLGVAGPRWVTAVQDLQRPGGSLVSRILTNITRS